MDFSVQQECRGMSSGTFIHYLGGTWRDFMESAECGGTEYTSLHVISYIMVGPSQ